MAALATIKGGGVFTRENIQQINTNFAALNTVDLWVRPQYGNNNGNGSVVYSHGSFGNAFASLAGCARAIEPGIVIGLQGVLLEEYSTPNINDVTIVGMANKPRQATTSGAPNGGGATWLSPASGASTHLITINGQGWVLDNLFMNNSTASMADVLLTNTGDGPALANAEHTAIRNCYLTGAKYGIRATGLPNWVHLSNNYLFGFSDTGDAALSSTVGAGTGTLSNWIIKGNTFVQNDIHVSAFGSQNAEWTENRFGYISGGITTVTQIDQTGGANNSVHNNYFDIPYDTADIDAMFVQGTDPRWYFNQFATAIGTTIYHFGAVVS